MNEPSAFEMEVAERGTDEPSMLVDVEGFEGPLDLLLALARQQKVDAERRPAARSKRTSRWHR